MRLDVPAPRALSLEHRLPLLITSLLLVVVVAYSWLAYREVRRTALDEATQRLMRVTRFLAQSSERSSAAAAAVLRDATTAEGDIAAYLRAPDAPVEARALAVMRGLATVRGDDTATVELWSEDRRRVLATAPSPAVGETEPVEAFLAALPDAESVAFGPIRVRGSDVYTSTVAPITVDGRRRGWVVRWSRLGAQPATANTITELVGSNAALYFVSTTGRIALDVQGNPVRFPAQIGRLPDTLDYSWPGRGRFVAASVPVRSSEWALVTEFPRAAILAPSTALLRRFALVALALLAAGAAAAWAISRGITRPLGQLTGAAERVAAGDLSARVETGRADELGRLASTFNAMGSNLGEAQRRLEQARASAESANAVKGDFLATMSHEIRTPLNAILGYTDLLQIGIAGPLTERQEEYLGRTQASGKHLLALLSDILDLSKIEAGGMEVRRETARASVAVDSALALVLPQAAARGIEIVNQCDESTSTRYVGDEGRVQQILANLLSNAVKFTNPGGRVTVRCSTVSRAAARGSTVQAWTTLQVQDTGVGIEPDRMAAVWEPFVQAEMGHTRAYGGTGLGLSISRRLARLMDGDLTAESTPGVGSTFTLWLPTAVALPPEGVTLASEAGAPSYSAR